MSSRLTMRYGVEGGAIAASGVAYTRLWTNDTPTASFASQTLALSDSATNYDALRIVWKYSAGTDVTEDNWSADDASAIAYIYDIRSKRDLIVSGQRLPNMGAVFYAASYAYARRAYFSADDAILFGSALRMNASGSDNNILIPLFIDGVKF